MDVSSDGFYCGLLYYLVMTTTLTVVDVEPIIVDILLPWHFLGFLKMKMECDSLSWSYTMVSWFLPKHITRREHG